jgi:sulfite reductase beta subunit-like hemoprotein
MVRNKKLPRRIRWGVAGTRTQTMLTKPNDVAVAASKATRKAEGVKRGDLHGRRDKQQREDLHAFA